VACRLLLEWKLLTSKLWLLVMVGIAFVLIGAFALSGQFIVNDENAGIHQNGTVIYLGFEGGFFGIVGDDGKHYDPINMSQEFQVDGLRVHFTANYTNQGSYHGWGYIVRLVSIQRLYPW
jgi:hypothetical protein